MGKILIIERSVKVKFFCEMEGIKSVLNFIEISVRVNSFFVSVPFLALMVIMP